VARNDGNPPAMMHDPLESRQEGPSLRIFLVGLAAAALLTLAAAVGTSMLHQQNGEQTNSLGASMARQ
jgi:hypothetical protein